jgi:protein involved in polysaccharide export with SLBB domain
VEKTTTVQEVVDRCGGYLPKANPERTYIIRNSKAFVFSPNENMAGLLKEKTPAFSIGSIRPEINLAFSRLSSLQDYSIISLKDQGFETLLEHGDQIIVPYEEPFVYVSGSVNNPGAYKFKEGEKYKYYIGLAGGFSGKADRGNTYVVSRFDTSIKIKNGKSVEVGDIIVVPDSQNNKFWISFILPMLQIISTATTVILAIATLAAYQK